jgi:hypothetical protein
MGWCDSHFVKDKFDRRYDYNVTLTDFLGRDMVWTLRLPNGRAAYAAEHAPGKPARVR